jgi:transglutaminase-like putative cysteine protease
VNAEPLEMTVRVGCHIVYQTFQPTPILLVVRPRSEGQQRVQQEKLTFSSQLNSYEFEDAHGNITYRAMLQPGQNIVHHDALVAVSSQPDNYGQQTYSAPIEELPPLVLRYALPSRYIDSDRLLSFAAQQFAYINNGLDRVYAICNWVHTNIEYRFGSGRPDISASEIISRRYGVCRDFAHAVIALCRALNLPARYVSGHLPDIGYDDPGTPMDFHAYVEVYLGQQWCTFDARFNVPRIGRVKVAQGLDAVDGAFGTIFGVAQLVSFEAWAYQVNPAVVSIDDPIDLSKRLDGRTHVRLS